LKSFIKLAFKIAGTVIVLALILYFFWVYVIPRLSEHEQRQQQTQVKETYTVKRVVDGDTFELDGKDENGKNLRVRLLGIDTPEKWSSKKLDKDAERTGKDKKTIQRLGELASDYVKKLCEGKHVNLVPEPNYEDKDVYGRLLRYIYLEDGTFVNRKIIEDGYANAFRKYPISKLEEFKKAEKEARDNKRGLWGEVEGLNQLDGNSNK
jgi:micrococcal nuclease